MTSPSPRAARAHALENCLAMVRAVNRTIEGSGTVVSIRLPALLPDAFAQVPSPAR